MRDSLPVCLFATALLGGIILTAAVTPGPPTAVETEEFRPDDNDYTLEEDFKILQDDHATPNDWCRAAINITRYQYPGRLWGNGADYQRRGRPQGNWAFEDAGKCNVRAAWLRPRQNPSVSELLHKRLDQLAKLPPETQTVRYMAEALYRWDGRAAIEDLHRVTPLIPKDELWVHLFYRAVLDDPRALDEEAAVVKAEFEKTGGVSRDNSYVLWGFPEEPAMRDLGEWLFTRKESPWADITLLGGRRSAGDEWLGLPAVQKQLLTGLASKELPEPNPFSETVPRRHCDTVANSLSGVPGFPLFDPLAPLAQRDAAVAECRRVLTQYGARFRYPDGHPEHPHHSTTEIMVFPPLAHPATPQDVSEGRAIFSLVGQGRARQLPIKLPAWGRWIEPRPPGARPGTKLIPTIHEGYLWQAETLNVNGQTKFFYGLVYPGGIATVPGEQFELLAPDENDTPEWSELTGGVDACIIAQGEVEIPERSYSYLHTYPLATHTTVLLRNRKGVPLALPAPRTATAPPPAGETALCPGVSMHLESWAEPDSTMLPFDRPWTHVPPRAAAAPRAKLFPTPPILAPGAQATLLEFDITRVFPTDSKHHYRLTVTFDRSILGFGGQSPQPIFTYFDRDLETSTRPEP